MEYKNKQTNKIKKLIETDGYQKGRGEKMGEKGKKNIVNNIVINLHSDRWLLKLVEWSHHVIKMSNTVQLKLIKPI